MLSVVFGLWALAGAASPFFVSALGPALFGLAFGTIALRADAAQRWRKTAIVGLGLNCVALVIVAIAFAV